MNTEKIFDIDTAQNGFEGYNKVISKNYDLVICDLNMPVMDGYLFCQKTISYFKNKIQFFDSKLNEDISYHRPYLIACSANVTNEIEMLAKISEFDLAILSPLNQDQLKNKIIPAAFQLKNNVII